jgi:hypothetical protein
VNVPDSEQDGIVVNWNGVSVNGGATKVFRMTVSNYRTRFYVCIYLLLFVWISVFCVDK